MTVTEYTPFGTPASGAVGEPFNRLHRRLPGLPGQSRTLVKRWQNVLRDFVYDNLELNDQIGWFVQKFVVMGCENFQWATSTLQDLAWCVILLAWEGFSSGDLPIADAMQAEDEEESQVDEWADLGEDISELGSLAEAADEAAPAAVISVGGCECGREILISADQLNDILTQLGCEPLSPTGLIEQENLLALPDAAGTPGYPHSEAAQEQRAGLVQSAAGGGACAAEGTAGAGQVLDGGARNSGRRTAATVARPVAAGPGVSSDAARSGGPMVLKSIKVDVEESPAAGQGARVLSPKVLPPKVLSPTRRAGLLKPGSSVTFAEESQEKVLRPGQTHLRHSQTEGVLAPKRSVIDRRGSMPAENVQTLQRKMAQVNTAAQKAQAQRQLEKMAQAKENMMKIKSERQRFQELQKQFYECRAQWLQEVVQLREKGSRRHIWNDKLQFALDAAMEQDIIRFQPDMTFETEQRPYFKEALEECLKVALLNMQGECPLCKDLRDELRRLREELENERGKWHDDSDGRRQKPSMPRPVPRKADPPATDAATKRTRELPDDPPAEANDGDAKAKVAFLYKRFQQLKVNEATVNDDKKFAEVVKRFQEGEQAIIELERLRKQLAAQQKPDKVEKEKPLKEKAQKVEHDTSKEEALQKELNEARKRIKELEEALAALEKEMEKMRQAAKKGEPPQTVVVKERATAEAPIVINQTGNKIDAALVAEKEALEQELANARKRISELEDELEALRRELEKLRKQGPKTVVQTVEVAVAEERTKEVPRPLKAKACARCAQLDAELEEARLKIQEQELAIEELRRQVEALRQMLIDKGVDPDVIDAALEAVGLMAFLKNKSNVFERLYLDAMRRCDNMRVLMALLTRELAKLPLTKAEWLQQTEGQQENTDSDKEEKDKMQPYIHAPPGCLPESTERAVFAAAAANERQFSTFSCPPKQGWRPFDGGLDNKPSGRGQDGPGRLAEIRSRLAKASTWVARNVRAASDWEWFWSIAGSPLPEGQADPLRCPCCGQESRPPSLAALSRSRDSTDFRGTCSSDLASRASEKRRRAKAVQRSAAPTRQQPSVAGKLASHHDSSAFEEYCRAIAEPEQEPCNNSQLLAPAKASKSFQLSNLLPGQKSQHVQDTSTSQPASRPGSSGRIRGAGDSHSGLRDSESLPHLGRPDELGHGGRSRSSSVTRLGRPGSGVDGARGASAHRVPHRQH
eukprot:TRINITY_DN29864_c0_g1_i1.p1 TRINITY_DN29864_c0_g1~~TRINITY_DN29864_c0_g1_i1.p1  ORF type:complete len:1208 (+),score=365.18 TRINITY_DN29864_c0_g1_i1:110-3733(+)